MLTKWYDFISETVYPQTYEISGRMFIIIIKPEIVA